MYIYIESSEADGVPPGLGAALAIRMMPHAPRVFAKVLPNTRSNLLRV